MGQRQLVVILLELAALVDGLGVVRAEDDPGVLVDVQVMQVLLDADVLVDHGLLVMQRRQPQIVVREVGGRVHLGIFAFDHCALGLHSPPLHHKHTHTNIDTQTATANPIIVYKHAYTIWLNVCVDKMHSVNSTRGHATSDESFGDLCGVFRLG